jgi:hypothetical protein
MAQAAPYKYEWINTSGETNSYLRQVDNIITGTISSVNWFKTEVIVEENFDFNPLSYSAYSATTLTSNELTYMFALPKSNGAPYTFEATITTELTAPYGGTFPPFAVAGLFQLWKYRQNTSPLLAERISSQNYYVTTPTAGVLRTTSITGTTTSSGSIYGVDLYFLTFTKVPGVPFDVKGATFKILESPVILPFTIELYKEMSCDQKQIEFITNINRTFNLVVVEHPFKPKTLIIEPMINYIGKGELLDWTDKVDYDATQNIYPTTNIINGSLFLANKADKDYINTEYTKRSNKIFGQNIIDLNIDYKNQTTNLTQTLGQNTDYYLNATGDTNVALPCYFITKENNNNGISTFEYRPFRSIPRQTFMSVSIPTGNTQTNPFFYRYAGTNNPFTVVGLTAMGTFPNYNRNTTYPFAIDKFSHYTIYDSSNSFTSDEIIYPTLENQYDRYYKDYIDDLTDDENKIYQVSMYLKPWEVANLYFNETIMIKNTKFRINKITGLSLLEPGMANVELVKLTRDYTPSPIIFYDLISCDNSCDIIHTHTDIVYPLWAFEGQFVDIYKGPSNDPPFKNVVRYQVIRTEYNEAYTYEIPYFDIYVTQTFNYLIFWDYAVYNSCSATTPTFRLEPFKDETTTAFTGTCVDMNITNTGSTELTFTFKYCDGTDGSWTLQPSSGITLCGLYSSFQTTGFTYCLDSFVPCIYPTFLPTPTPTLTPGLSPTPTRTPLPTPGLSPTPSITPSPTPSNSNCRINTTLNVTNFGWIKYTLCNGSPVYQYVSVIGTYTIIDCIRIGTVIPGFPYSDVAIFTTTSSGTTC